MKTLLAALALILATASAALAFDSDSQAIIDKHKPGKRLSITDVGHLMQASERWCYAQEDKSCEWTDIYLEVNDVGATFEIANAWDFDTDIAFTDQGKFIDGRYICENGHDWVTSVRATRRSDDSIIAGRDLAALKTQIYEVRTDDTQDCFDYLYLGADAETKVVTLLQRQYLDGEHLDADVEVSVHFSPKRAAGLTLRW